MGVSGAKTREAPSIFTRVGAVLDTSSASRSSANASTLWVTTSISVLSTTLASIVANSRSVAISRRCTQALSP
jgi:hypothetical protein